MLQGGIQAVKVERGAVLIGYFSYRNAFTAQRAVSIFKIVHSTSSIFVFLR
jgi:hypothetical protein